MAHDYASISPKGASVNDSIPKDQFSLQYATVDEAVALVQGALMAKVDLCSAFRMVPKTGSCLA